MAHMERSEAARLVVVVYGQVQGVGFRWWTRCRAVELGLRGHAMNLPDGSVEVLAEGHRACCDWLLGRLGDGSPPGRVDRLEPRWTDATGDLTTFVER
jgi:acylphosphatase